MYKFFTEVIKREPLAFVVVGCAFVLVGVMAAIPFTNLSVQNETHQLVLFVFGLLLIAGAFGLAAKDWFLHQPPPDSGLRKINPKAYGVKIDPPPNDGVFKRGAGTLTGSVRKPLPPHLELWLVNLGSREGLPEYWPDKSITVKNKKWEVTYEAKNFKDLDKRKLQLYIVGQDGRRLFRCFRRINERHVAKSTQEPKPQYEAIPELTSDIVEACSLIEVTLSKPAS